MIPVPETTRAARGFSGSSTLRSTQAPLLTPADAGLAAEPAPPPSPLAGKTAAELLAIARDRLVERDLRGALEAADAARRAAPEDPDIIAIGTWARFQLGRADVKALAVELDELLAVHSDHVDARFYRAMLRKRLSDQSGCAGDLRRLLETQPDHAEAARELAAIESRPALKERPSLFGRLFKR